MCAVATCSHSHSYSCYGERVQVYIHIAVDEISNSRSIHKRYRSETPQKTSPKTAMHKCGCDCAVRILKMSSRDHHHLSTLAYPSIHPFNAVVNLCISVFFASLRLEILSGGGPSEFYARTLRYRTYINGKHAMFFSTEPNAKVWLN